MDQPQFAFETFLTSQTLFINKKLLELLGPVKTVFISNLIDKYKEAFDQKSLDTNGGFYLTHKSQMKELRISENTLQKCKREFKAMGIISAYRKDGYAHQPYYKIDLENFFEKIESYANRKILAPIIKEERHNEKARDHLLLSWKTHFNRYGKEITLFVRDFLIGQKKKWPLLFKRVNITANSSRVLQSLQTIESLIKIDEIPLPTIISIISKATNDKFWSKQVTSLGGLRRISRNGNTKFTNMMLHLSNDNEVQK